MCGMSLGLISSQQAARLHYCMACVCKRGAVGWLHHPAAVCAQHDRPASVHGAAGHKSTSKFSLYLLTSAYMSAHEVRFTPKSLLIGPLGPSAPTETRFAPPTLFCQGCAQCHGETVAVALHFEALLPARWIGSCGPAGATW